MANLGELVYALGIDTSQLRRSEQEVINSVKTIDNSMSQLASRAKSVAKVIAGLYVVNKVRQFAMETTHLAARYETLGIVMQTVGKNAYYSARQLDDYAKRLQENGITMMESRQQITRMVQAQIDLTKAVTLGRIAQDAAVIGNVNSSEAFARMIWGIKSGQIEILRTLGLNVNFQQSYEKMAKQLGRTSQSLTEYEKMLARVGAVEEEGKKITDTYKNAMGTAGKLINSTVRLVENAKVMIGQFFLPSYTRGVNLYYNALTKVNEELERLINSGDITEWGVKAKRAFEMATKGALDFLKVVGIGAGIWAFLRFGPRAFAAVAGAIKLTSTSFKVLALIAKEEGIWAALTTRLWGISAAAYAATGVFAALATVLLIAGSAIAGWKFGTWLRNFKLVRDMADAFVLLTMKGLIELEHKFDTVSASIGNIWETVIDKLKGLWIEFLELVSKSAAIMSNIPLFGFLEGVSERAKNLARDFGVDRALFEAFGDIDNAEQGLKIEQDYQSALAVHEKVAESYYMIAGAADEAGRSAKELNEAIDQSLLENFGELDRMAQQLKESWEQAFLRTKSKLEGMRNSLSDQITGIQKGIDPFIRYNQLLRELDKITEGGGPKVKKLADEIKALNKELAEKQIEQASGPLKDYIKSVSDLALYGPGLFSINEEFTKMKELLDGLTEAATNVGDFEGLTKLISLGEQLEEAKQIKIAEYFKGQAEAIEDAFNQINFTAAFSDPILDGISKVMMAFNRYTQTRIAQERQLEKLDNERKAAEALEGQEKLDALALIKDKEILFDQQIFESKLGNTRALLGATAQMFDENSKAREALHRMEMVYGALELALSIKKTAQNAMEAITNQGKGDPYTAFARIAAMAAMRAGLGVFAGSGGGGAPSLPVGGRDYEFGGTVLGAGDEASDSIAKSYAILDEIHKEEWGTLIDRYEEMRDLNNNIMGLVSSVVRTGGFDSASLAGLASRDWLSDSGVVSFLDSLTFGMVGDAADWLFGGSSTYGVGAGLNFPRPTSIQNLLAGRDMYARTYQMTRTDESGPFGGLFGGDDTYYTYYFDSVTAQTQKLFTDVFTNMSETLVMLAEKLGADVSEAYAYVFEIDEYVNLKDKTGEEVNKIINDLISEAGDKAAEAILGSVIGMYQKVGEGLLETGVRLLAGKEMVSTMLSKIGLSLDDAAQYAAEGAGRFVTKITEIMVNTIGGGSIFGKILRNMFGAIKQQVTTTEWVAATVSEKLIEISQALIDFAGGLDEFTDLVGGYYDDFTSDIDKFLDVKDTLADAFAGLGSAIPTQRDLYSEFIKTLDLSTEAGQKAFISLMELADAADYFYDIVEENKGRLKEMELEVGDIIAKHNMPEDEYKKMVGLRDIQSWYDKQVKILDDMLGMYLITGATYNNMLQDLNTAVEYMTDDLMASFDKAYTNWRDFLASMDLSDLSPVQSVEEYQNRYNQLLSGGMSDEFLNFVKGEYLPFMQEFSMGGGIDYAELYANVVADIIASGTAQEEGIAGFDQAALAEAVTVGIQEGMDGMTLIINVDGNEIGRVVADQITGGNTDIVTALLTYLQ